MTLPKRLFLMAACLLAWGGCDLGEPTGGGTGVDGLSGYVVDPSGAPVAGAWVKVYAANDSSVAPAALAKGAAANAAVIDSAQTDAQGAFEIPKLVNGTYNVAGTLARGDTTLSLFVRGLVLNRKNSVKRTDTLKVSGTLTLRITAGGLPLPGAECFIPGSPYAGESDETGACLLNGLPPGTFDIVVTHSGFQVGVLGDLQVLSGILTEAGVLNLIGIGQPPATAPVLVSPAPSVMRVVPDSGRLTWRAAASAVTYHVQMAVDSGFTAPLLDDSVRVDTTRAYGPLTKDTLYYWRVRARNLVGFGPWSAPRKIITVKPIGGGLGSPSSTRYFGITSSTVALWTFNDSAVTGKYEDVTGHGHALSAPNGATSSPAQFGKAALFNGSVVESGDASLILAGHDLITFEARIWLDEYPSSSQVNGLAQVIGNYAGLMMYIGTNGRIESNAQISDGSNWNWFGGQSVGGVIPLKQWVDVAVAADKLNGKTYAYVNGFPVQLYTDGPIPTGTLRGYTGSPFNIGGSSVNNQPFLGKIDEVRVSSGLVLGTGLPLVTDASKIWNSADLPATLTVTAPTANATLASDMVSLLWSSSARATSYQVQVSTSSAFLSLLLDTTLTGHSKMLFNLTPATYYWRVRAANTAGAGAWTTVRAFTCTTGTAEIPAAPASHFGATASTVALWTFDEAPGTVQYADSTQQGHTLNAPAAATSSVSPYGRAVQFNGSVAESEDTTLILAGHDRLTFEVRIWLDEYPSSSLNNGVSQVIGNYAGLMMYIGNNGRIQAGAQIGDGISWNWFGGETGGGAVPLKQWVDVAVAADRANGKTYAYVNGVPLQLYTDGPVATGVLRPYTGSTFNLGGSSVNPQPFPGKFDEVRVSDGLVLGAGPPLLNDPSKIWRSSALPAAVTTNAALSTDTTVLSWNSSSLATFYQVQVSTDTGFAAPMLDTTVTGTSLVLRNLSSATYRWRVRAGNAAGTSDWSAVRVFIRTTDTPGVPSSHFGATASTVALWTFDEASGAAQFKDSTGNGHSLSAPGAATTSASPLGKAVQFNGAQASSSETALMLAGHDLVTFEARIWMDAYPSSAQFNKVAYIMGNYGGLAMYVSSDGRLFAGAQIGGGSTWDWLGAATVADFLPLGQWVDVAVAADKQNGKIYAYLNGEPVQLYINVGAGLTGVLRTYSVTPFTIGGSSVDSQPFAGKIEEVRVSDGLVLGAGLPISPIATPKVAAE